MNRKLALLFTLLLALTSAALAWQQRQALLARQLQITSLAGEVAKKKEALQEQAAVLDRLREENEVYRTEFAVLREKASSQMPGSEAHGREDKTSTSSSEDPTTKIFSRMAKDPKFKEVMRQWQVAQLKQIYGDFVRDRLLNPQQKKQFFDLLVQDSTRAREETAELLGGEEKGTGVDEPGSVPRKAEIEQQLKLLLGDTVYAEYEEYKKSTGSRLILLQIHEHFARTSVPLQKDQANTLLEMMLEENGLNQRVLDRMGTVLTPEQAQELQRYQDESRALDRVRMETAREMMERKSKSDPPAPVPSP